MGEKKYRAVLLDLDGTLMDTSEGIFSSIRHATDVLGLPYPDPVTLKTFIGPPIVSSMGRVYGMSHEEALHANEIFQEAYRGGDVMKAHCYEGIMDLLRRLRERGAKVGVVTYDRRAREAGESKYTLRKMLKLALKGMECGRCRPKSVPRGADPWIAEALHE